MSKCMRLRTMAEGNNILLLAREVLPQIRETANCRLAEIGFFSESFRRSLMLIAVYAAGAKESANHLCSLRKNSTLRSGACWKHLQKGRRELLPVCKVLKLLSDVWGRTRYRRSEQSLHEILSTPPRLPGSAARSQRRFSLA